MEQNSLPQETQKGCNKPSPDKNPSSDTPKYDKDKIGPFDIDVAITAIEVIGGFIFGTIGFAFSDAHIQLAAYFFYFLTVGCGIGIVSLMLKRLDARYFWKTFWVLMACNFILFSGLSWRAYLTERAAAIANATPPQSFSVRTTLSIVCVTNDATMIWFVHHGLDGKGFISPVCVAFYIELTSLKDFPMELNSYSVEGQRGKGNWQTIPSFDVRFGSFYHINFMPGPVLTNALQVDFQGDFLQSHLDGKTIEPRATVEGWMFLDIQTWELEQMNLRLRTEDKTGVISYQPIVRHEPVNGDVAFSRQAHFQILNTHDDISRWPITNYVDGTKGSHGFKY